MGTIYRGEDEGGRPVAIKVMRPELAADSHYVRRFLREARASSVLRHRSTVGILDHGVEGGTPYIVMELVEGRDLHLVLDGIAEGRVDEARAARIVAQVCSALAAAHDLGIVHRDLKPENVMLTTDEAGAELVKVLDFGIAKRMAPGAASPDAIPVSTERPVPSSGGAELTTMGTLLGTPDFMAPEQLRGDPVDARTDVYACGLLLYLLVTGRVPLAADDAFMTARLRSQFEPQPPSLLVPGTHRGLEALILAALARSPADRPSSARRMQEQLLALLPELAEGLRDEATRSALGAAVGTLGDRHSSVTLSSFDGDDQPASLRRLPTPAPQSNQNKFHNLADWAAVIPPRALSAPPAAAASGRSRAARVVLGLGLAAVALVIVIALVLR